MNIAKRIWNVVSTALVVLIVIIALFSVLGSLFGIREYMVMSGSMEPEYSVGDLAVVKKIDTADIKVGDVITFLLSDDVIATHRVTEVVRSEDDGQLRFRTKGDMNDTGDGLVHNKNVLGIAIFRIPKLGYAVNFIQNPPGIYFAIIIVILLLVFAFIPDSKKKNNV